MANQKCEPRSSSETATQRLASILLKQDVNTFISDRRAVGVAWRHIARDLYEATNGQIDVTYETLRNWHGGEAA